MGGNAMDKWDRRWCVLSSDGFLRYYKSKKEAASGAESSGELDCNECTVEVNLGMSSSIFMIRTHDRVLTLKAHSDELQPWLDAIHNCSSVYTANHIRVRRQSESLFRKAKKTEEERRREAAAQQKKYFASTGGLGSRLKKPETLDNPDLVDEHPDEPTE